MQKFWAFLAGAFGGMSPVLLRIGIDLTQNGKDISELTISIVVGMAILGGLGGGVALVWGESDLKKLFYVGIGLPSLLTVVTTTASGSKPGAAAPTAALLHWTVSAADAAPPGIYRRSVRFVLDSKEFPADETLSAVFRPEAPNGPARIALGTLMPVPPNAQGVQVASESGDSAWVTLPATSGANITVTLRAERNFYYGFYYALGIKTKPFMLVAASSVTPDQFDALSVRFNTLRDDKDWDTRVTVQLRDAKGTVYAALENLTGEFKERSANGPFPLRLLKPFGRDQWNDLTLWVRVDPNESDEWEFSAAVLARNGEALIETAFPRTELSEDQREAWWPLKPPPLMQQQGMKAKPPVQKAAAKK